MNQSGSTPTSMKPYCQNSGSVSSESNKCNSVKVVMDEYGRQNSMNEIKENADLSPKTGHHNMTGYLRQTSECPFFPGKAVRVDMKTDSFQSTDTIISDDSFYDEKKQYESKTHDFCCRMIQFASFLVAMSALGLVLFLFNKVYKIGYGEVPIYHLPETRIESLESKYVYDDVTDDVSGSFRLDQQYLNDTKLIRWMADENSKIVPNKTEPCLLIPDNGKYLIISRFTFRIPPGEKETIITHQLELRVKRDNGEKTTRKFKRQYVSIVEHKLNENSELRKSSNFIQSFEIKAGNEVCTKVSSPELLYVSSIDNDVTVIKV